jgi:hypothetical protein
LADVVVAVVYAPFSSLSTRKLAAVVVFAGDMIECK